MRVRASKAREAGLEKDPAIRLLSKFRRANLLAELYTMELQKKLKPSPDEMKKYLEEHPEADAEKIKQKAEQLLARVKKGEDFNAIASQYTEDATREQGGDLGWFQKGKMDPDFENAAFGLQKGQTANSSKPSSVFISSSSTINA
jgi:parvulin-like peptidyl-prolyl isomerase